MRNYEAITIINPQIFKIILKLVQLIPYLYFSIKFKNREPWSDHSNWYVGDTYDGWSMYVSLIMK